MAIAVEWLVVGMGGGVVWGFVGICTGEQLSGRSVSLGARETAFRVVSVVVRVLSCGSDLRLGSVRGATCWIPGFPNSYQRSSQEWTDTAQSLSCRMKLHEGFGAG